jgi:hypothetical protein
MQRAADDAPSPGEPLPEERRILEKFVGFPGAGPNSFRPKILVAAFASGVLTVADHDLVSIRGQPDADVTSDLTGKQGARRLLAFRV